MFFVSPSLLFIFNFSSSFTLILSNNSPVLFSSSFNFWLRINAVSLVLIIFISCINSAILSKSSFILFSVSTKLSISFSIADFQAIYLVVSTNSWALPYTTLNISLLGEFISERIYIGTILFKNKSLSMFLSIISQSL